MVQGLQEEMEGVKTQLKRRRSSLAEGDGSGSAKYPKARRGSKGSPLQARGEKRGPSSSPPSALDSDHDDLRSDEWSSSDDEARRREVGRGYRDARHHHRRLSAPARGRMERGYYPYGGPPGVYPYAAPLFYPPVYPGFGGGGYATGMPMGIQVGVLCSRSKAMPTVVFIAMPSAVAAAVFICSCRVFYGRADPPVPPSGSSLVMLLVSCCSIPPSVHLPC